MKTLTQIAIFMFAVCTTGLSQTTQMNNWYIAPNRINMTVPNPFPAAISPAIGSTTAATALHVANGFYDNTSTGDLLFYIADGTVYDYNNTKIGAIPNGGAEIAVVPFGNNDYCHKKFNIFTTAGGLIYPVALWKTVLDMNSYSLSSLPIDSVPFGSEFGAIAVGKVIDTANNRYLYFLGGSGFINTTGGLIKKLIIHNDGSVSSSVPVYPTSANPNYNAGGEVFSKELELSPDGKWLAWASYALVTHQSGPQYRYHLIELDGSGDYINNSYKKFNIPNYSGNNISGFRGVEFFQPANATKLFMGAGTDGVFYINLPWSNWSNYPTPPPSTDFTRVVNSNTPNNFGFSQIELAHSNNGFMYAVADPGSITNNVGAFNPYANTPQILPSPNSFPLSNPPYDLYNLGGVNPNSTMYTLPDQIDGQDYSLITSSPIPHVITTNTINFPDNSSINQNATWSYGATNNPLGASTPIYVLNELRVKQNSNLTINGMMFKFSPNAKVIIEPGSTLTLDGGAVLTSDYLEDPCLIPYTWQGVEVWGNQNNQSQNIVPSVVGKLIVNNATIEYAVCGARAQRNYGSYVNLHRGGIIIATAGAKFKNCLMDVEFLPYQNIYNGIEYSNKSYFAGATFENNIKYVFQATPIHAHIDGCFGIRFVNCDFINFNSQAIFDMLSMGIKSLNANYTVSDGCTFLNLFHAIDAKRTAGNNSITVLGSTFTNNQTGIYVYNINNLKLQSNYFYIGNNFKTGANVQLGISTIFCSGFTIEENHFFRSNPNIATVFKYGISTNSCGQSANQIYKNYFTDMSIGNYSTGINRNPIDTRLTGLQYLCNENTSNDNFDFFISGKGSPFSGIRLLQGTSKISAGNIFSYTGLTGTFTDINNVTAVALSYYFDQSKAPQYYNSQVAPILAAFSNTCPSHICQNCNDLLTNGEIQQMTDSYDSSETAFLNLLYSYNQLLDGGNTNILLNQIQQSWSSNAVDLRDHLMGISPYVSADALREAAGQDIMPPAMLLMVCLANPDATRDEALLEFMQYSIVNSLSQYMVDLIRASWDDGTPRTAIENMLADYNSQMAVISDRLLSDLYAKMTLDMDSIIIGDTTDYSRQIIYWLTRAQTLTAKYDLIENYLAANELTSAELVLSSIPVDFTLSDDQQNAYNDYCYFYSFRNQLQQDSSDLSMLDSTQINQLMSFVQGELSFAKGMAQNALCFYYGMCREDDYSTEEASNRIRYHGNTPKSINTNTTAMNVRIEVVPNPASQTTTFNYFIPTIKEQIVLSVFDMSGKELKQFTVSDKQGTIKWDLGNVGSGLYYYTVKDGETKIAKGKITVKK